MVYVGRDGRVYDKQPWSLSRLFSIFIGFFTAIALFFRSLIDPFTNQNGFSGGSGQSFWRGSSGGGGGGGGGSDGRGPPGPPRRRPMGRIMHMSDVTVPGGCPGGSCGR